MTQEIKIPKGVNDDEGAEPHLGVWVGGVLHVWAKDLTSQAWGVLLAEVATSIALGNEEGQGEPAGEALGKMVHAFLHSIQEERGASAPDVLQ